MNSVSDWVSRGIRNKAHHFQRAGLWVTEANETERNLSNALIAIGTIFLGITSPLVSDFQLLDKIQKIFIIFSWIFSVLSLLFGAIQYFINMNFFANLSKVENDQEEIWSEITFSEDDYKRVNEKSKEKAKEINLESNTTFFFYQIFSLILAILLVVFVGADILFMNVSIKDEASTVIYVLQKNQFN